MNANDAANCLGVWSAGLARLVVINSSYHKGFEMNKLTAGNEEILAKLAKNKRSFNWPLFGLILSGVAFWAVVIWLFV